MIFNQFQKKKYYLLALSIFIIATVLFLLLIRYKSGRHPDAPHGMTERSINKIEAVQIAERYLKENGQLPTHYHTEVLGPDAQGVWTIFVSKMPASPGGHVAVLLRKDGSVSQLIKGK